MDLWLVIYVLLAFLSTCALLASPYLRITSLGWFISIWCLPYLGALFFILTVVRARASDRNEAYCHLREGSDVQKTDTPFEHLGFDCNFLPYFSMGNSTILKDDEFIRSVYLSIENARQRVWISTYILSGQLKDEMIQRLTNAHERGVDVRLLVDRIGSGLFLAPNDSPLKNHDVPFQISVLYHSRIKSLLFMEKRLHSKIVISDEEAFVGAHNLRDEIESRHDENVHNVSLQFNGSVVNQLVAVFCDLWQMNSGEKINFQEVEPERFQEEGGKPARIIFSDPIGRSHNYNRYLTILFHAARARIYIWMPYVIPTQTMRNTIIAASKIGLDVRVLMPKKSDSALVDNAHSLVLKEFTDNGVNCAVSTGDFDHSKILIIDDLSVIGSTNLDYRSLYRNYEANIEVNDKRFTQSIIHLFNEKFSLAEPVEKCNKPLVVHMKNQLTSLIAGLY